MALASEPGEDSEAQLPLLVVVRVLALLLLALVLLGLIVTDAAHGGECGVGGGAVVAAAVARVAEHTDRSATLMPPSTVALEGDGVEKVQAAGCCHCWRLCIEQCIHAC